MPFSLGPMPCIISRFQRAVIKGLFTHSDIYVVNS
jgi:hypothetical protein